MTVTTTATMTTATTFKPQVIAVARSSDLILMVLDGAKEGVNQHRKILERELETVGLRLNKTPPNVYYR